MSKYVFSTYSSIKARDSIVLKSSIQSVEFYFLVSKNTDTDSKSGFKGKLYTFYVLSEEEFLPHKGPRAPLFVLHEKDEIEFSWVANENVEVFRVLNECFGINRFTAQFLLKSDVAFVFDEIQSLNYLTWLDLSRNDFHEYDIVLSSEILETLIMTRCNLKDDKKLESLRLPNLKRLDLSHNSLDELRYLPTLMHVIELKLEGNPLRNFNSSKMFPNLEALNVLNSRIETSEGLNFPMLKTLNVGSCNLRSLDFLNISTLPSLKSFTAHMNVFNSVNFKVFARFRWLKWINLNSTSIRECIGNKLTFELLETLLLRMNNISANGFALTNCDFPSLKVLDLYRNRNHRSWEWTSSNFFPELKKLCLNDNDIRNFEDFTAANMPQLHSLTLESNPLQSTVGLESSSLMLLNFSHCPNLDDVSNLIDNPANLKEVDLRYTLVDAADKVALYRSTLDPNTT